jgi:hypothetical protein
MKGIPLPPHNQETACDQTRFAVGPKGEVDEFLCEAFQADRSDRNRGSNAYSARSEVGSAGRNEGELLERVDSEVQRREVTIRNTCPTA